MIEIASATAEANGVEWLTDRADIAHRNRSLLPLAVLDIAIVSITITWSNW